MIKNKNTISPLRITKKSIRPYSSGANLSKKQKSSNLINNIIVSLEKNVKDLKNYYHTKEESNQVGSQDKFQKGFRVKRGLIRNSSQINFNPKNEDKSQNDIFEIRNEYSKVNGRTTNNIVQLYDFYKKNIEKREKSTRILASMELSNGGQSISGGKQSLLKHSLLLNHRQISKKENDFKIDEKNEESNNMQTQKFPLQVKKAEKTSELANELISKGCYNIMNIANLLNCKKYRLTKEKQQSFKQSNVKKNKQLLAVIEAEQKQGNKQNNINKDNIVRNQQLSLGKQTEIHLTKNQLNAISQSPQFNYKPEISFKKNSENVNELIKSNIKSFEWSSISKQDKDIEKRIHEENFMKKEEFNEIKISNQTKIDTLLYLEESPIHLKNGKQFEKSKYYVKPIPQKSNDLCDQKSISLRSNSRIIDIDSLPFDL